MTVSVFRPQTMGVGVRIASLAGHVPSRTVTNADLVAMGAPLDAAEIEKLTGIRERHWASADEAVSDLAIAAGKKALGQFGNDLERVSRLLLATVSSDFSSPSTACIVQHALGLAPRPAFDISAACSGFLYALDAAARFIATGDHGVLVAAADARSKFLDVKDRGTAALFGDGAVAAMVTPGPVGEGLLSIALVADGSGATAVHVPAGGSRKPATKETVEARQHFIQMKDGPEVYFQAVEGMLTMSEVVLKDAGLTFADVDLVVPHQANGRLLERLVRLSRLPKEKVMVNVDRYGNTAGASCGLALTEALATRRVRAGSRVLLLAAGGGFTAGAALLRVDETLLRATVPL